MIPSPTMPLVETNSTRMATKAMAVMTRLKVSVASTPR
jgi:hypothetical protein